MVRVRFKDEIRVREHPFWSPSRLDLAETCMKAYWLSYVKQIKPLISPSTARGKLIHSMIEGFWKTDRRTKEIIPIPKYSFEGFINTGIARWERFYANPNPPGGRKPTDEIKWDFPGQQYSKAFRGELADILARVYNRYINEEPRLAAEKKLFGNFNGIKIMAIVDELRKDLVIRDHKSGYARPNPEYLEKNVQMTDYMVCLFMALQDSRTEIYQKIYPDYAGIGLTEFLDTAKIEIHHLPDMNKPYFSRKTGEFVFPERDVMTSIHPAKRNTQNIKDFLESLQAKEKCLKERDFHPHQGRHCGYCFYKEDCKKFDPKNYHINELERNMPLFSFSNLGFENMKSTNPLINPQIPEIQKQKTFRFKYITEEDDPEVKELSKKLDDRKRAEEKFG